MTTHDRFRPTENEALVQASQELRIVSEHLASFSETLRAEARRLRGCAKDTYTETARMFDG